MVKRLKQDGNILHVDMYDHWRIPSLEGDIFNRMKQQKMQIYIESMKFNLYQSFSLFPFFHIIKHEFLECDVKG